MTDNMIPDVTAAQGVHVVNPEAIGNPDVQPIVQLDADTAEWITSQPGYCAACGGLNWFHSAGCTEGEAH